MSRSRLSVRFTGYRQDMPHWIALLAIVMAAWLIVAVVGGWLIGRGLGVIDRHQELDET